MGEKLSVSLWSIKWLLLWHKKSLSTTFLPSFIIGLMERKKSNLKYWLNPRSSNNDWEFLSTFQIYDVLMTSYWRMTMQKMEKSSVEWEQSQFLSECRIVWFNWFWALIQDEWVGCFSVRIQMLLEKKLSLFLSSSFFTKRIHHPIKICLNNKFVAIPIHLLLLLISIKER